MSWFPLESQEPGVVQIACPHCSQALEFSGRRPNLCGFCGGSLAAFDRFEAPTLVAPTTDEATPQEAATVWKPSDVIGGYRLVRLLGQGGMGGVYEAEEQATGRRVALKLLSPELARTEESLDRFVREGRLAAAFSHPRSTFVFEAGQHQGQPFIAMELMPGRTLSDVCRDEGPLPVRRAVDYLLDVIDGLEAAHAAGVIHRDVKPSNCFLDADGRVKIGDFGLSKSHLTDAALTRTGAFMGTPLFAAPEQVRGGTLDNRTDVYALGATLFYLIAGRGPFAGDVASVIAQISSDQAPSLRSLVPAVPRDLDRIVARTLQKDPQRRYANLTELRTALQPFAGGVITPAPIGMRLGAFLLDMLLTGTVFGSLVAFVVFLVVFLKGFSGSVASGASGIEISESVMVKAAVRSMGLVFVLVVLYFAICESWTGKSLGKRLLGLAVVGLDGGRPAFRRALLRALIVPGLSWIAQAVLIPLQVSNFGPDSPQEPFDLIYQQLLNWLTFVPALLCLVTMRASNGYAGVHDLLSGTRVVRMQITRRESRSIEKTRAVERVEDGQQAFGPFRVVGLIGTSPDGKLLLGVDPALRRQVWICVRPRGPSLAVGAARAGVARTTRPRWLQAGEADQSRWDAFEAVNGAPANGAKPAAGTGWASGRFVLLDLIDELVAASADGTLPACLSLDQVWIDRHNRLKLLDWPVSLARTERESQVGTAATFSPVGLVRAVAALFSSGQILPIRAQEFFDELLRRPDEHETLTWAAASLSKLLNQPTELSWSDRLVAIGASAGIEYSLYQVAVSLLALPLLHVSALSQSAGIAVLLLAGFALPAAVGFATWGGPVFRVLDIGVRRSDGRLASRVRCAMRNVIAWLPAMLSIVMNVSLLPTLAGAGTATSSANALEPARMALVVLVVIGSALVLLLHLAGACFALISPRRGIQDLLAGTRLVPR